MDQTQSLSDNPPSLQIWRYYFTIGFAAAIVLALVVGFCLAIVAIINSSGNLNPLTHLLPLPLMTTVYGLIAIQINRVYPRHTVGWLLMVVAFMLAVTFLTASYMEFERFVLQQTGNATSVLLIWINCWVWFAPSTIPITLLLLYFPDGQLPSSRWKPIAIMSYAGIFLGTVAAAFHPDSIPDDAFMSQNPFALSMFTAELEFLIIVSSFLLLVGTLGSFASIFVKYRRARNLVRNQIKWLLYSAACTIGMLLVWGIFRITQPENQFVSEVGLMIIIAGISIISITIGIAILKHQLWDVDILINRTVVYSLLSLVTVAIYLMVVTFFSAVFDDNNLLFSFIATGIIAVSFHTIRDYVQKNINRMLFGNRDDPYLVIENLSKQLEPIVAVDEVLPTIIKSIAEVLRLPYVAIALSQEKRYKVIASYPSYETKDRFENIVKLNLEFRAEHIGQLWLAQRSQNDQFSQAELNLLSTIARQVSVAAYNIRLTEELQRSREDLVTTREEERRRLRRDLHDGLGPVLASISLGLDAIRNLAETDSTTTITIATELKQQVQTSLSEVRRIAYALRPPALDELGLVGALREHFNTLNQAQHPKITFTATARKLTLPAAVEVATYRIALEAVTNVQRHANANNCYVDLVLMETALSIRVADDGKGIPDDYRAGVGMTSMRERAEELGGQCKIIRQNQGLLVEAILPVS